ncbi:aspartyl/glutamyl-tRNA(Asn/Gln) amidotransferase subunit A [Caloramator fervidus]|uniref:Glutamyl-tRNA(Gln) amidotransferase subunit A n=2 Tax=Caloramator fervidus TaxID=29344 RepID=A0A1H5V9Q0_9CLOT|nr:Asp-tRNA(Asn)/Glu-tRNA(Gln) amidotransferase subunit GatA [Caloramator fervidus]SEF84059.1 aspartyl/glutamyl-tRNA(Asn/Gln) amidotransferase subunit A [Caloramator fervidus]
MHFKSAHEVRDLLRKKEISSEELTKLCLERIEKVDAKVEAFLEVFEDALDTAKEIDKKILSGENLPDLAGIPMGIKDNICMEGKKVTCASKMLENFVSPYDATVVERLKKNGAVILGRLNMDEFAMGSSTENSAFKKTRNPYDLERVPGGSSGGSAAAVAAGEVYYSLGSDTGGSIRQPASLCGVVGFKPTYGRVSRYGLVAFASSLDQIGPFTRDVEDAALVLNAICGKDDKDSTSKDVAVEDFTTYLNKSLKGVKVGLPKEYFGEGIDDGVKKEIEKAIEVLKDLGAEVKQISLPMSQYALSVYYILASSEASSNLARFDGIRYGYRAKDFEDIIDLYVKSRSQGFGSEVKRRIMLGTYALSSGYYDAYYKKALKVKTLIINEFKKAFEDVNLIVSPTSPSVAFKFGEKSSDPLKMYLSDICTVPVNIAGLPAVSVPVGFSDNLPVGLQIIGNYFKEGEIISLAHGIEKALNLNLRPNV